MFYLSSKYYFFTYLILKEKKIWLSKKNITDFIL